MMVLWRESYTRRAIAILLGSGAISLVAHSVIIGGALLGTRRPPEIPGEGLANKVYYMPPPDRTRAAGVDRETITYLALAPTGIGSGVGAASALATKISLPDLSPSPGSVAPDTAGAKDAPPPLTPLVTRDSVFSVLEVDTAVVRSENSAAPAYPLSLLKKNISGSVAARYVVDTTGFADTASFEVIRATHPDFVSAVRAALPYMRFTPAKNGNRRVRQLVEQEFTFRITAADAAPPIKPGVATQNARP